MSLYKFFHQQRAQDAAGPRLHWNRAGMDGAPFRGDAAPLLREDEADERLERVYDAHARVFDLDLAADRDAYQAVLDKAANGWVTIRKSELIPLKRKIRVDPKTIDEDVHFKVYVEWFVPYMVDTQPDKGTTR